MYHFYVYGMYEFLNPYESMHIFPNFSYLRYYSLNSFALHLESQRYIQ